VTVTSTSTADGCKSAGCERCCATVSAQASPTKTGPLEAHRKPFAPHDPLAPARVPTPQPVVLVDRIAWQWYLATAAIPFIGALVGFIAGIVFMARSKIGPALALWATAWLAAMVWGAIGWGILVLGAVEGVSDSADVPVLIEPAADESSEPVEPAIENDPPPTENPDAESDTDLSAATKACGNLTVTAGSTTCGFAQNVFYEYWTATDSAVRHEDTIEAYSPTLDDWLELTCADGDPVVCTTGAGAGVQMPRSALDAYTKNAADAYAADHTVSP
jgi:hypothetical protein